MLGTWEPEDDQEEVVEFTRKADGPYAVLVGYWYKTEDMHAWIYVYLPGQTRSFCGAGDSMQAALQDVKKVLWEHKIDYNEILLLDGRTGTRERFLAAAWLILRHHPHSFDNLFPADLFVIIKNEREEK